MLLCLSITQVIHAQATIPSYQAVNYLPTFITGDMEVRYEFSNTSSYPGSGNSVTDLMGVQQNATIVNSPSFNSTEIKSLNLVSASSNHIITNAITSTLNESVFLWVYPTGNGVILSELGQSTINYAWHDSQIEIVGSQIRFAVWQYTVGNPQISSSLALNMWHYVGFTYDGTTLRAFIDGASVGTFSISRQIPQTLYYGIGATDATNLGNGGYGNFRLGAFHFYRRALSPNEVLLNYQATSSAFSSSTQFKYWVYSTNGGTGLTNQYPANPSNISQMDQMFDISNSNTTLSQTGSTNSASILDWTTTTDLSNLGINLPNSGSYASIKIQGTFVPLETGSYIFTLSSDDASDLSIDGQYVIQTYSGQAVQALGTRNGTISLVAGRSYSYTLRQQNSSGDLGMRLYWKSPSQAASDLSGYTSNWTQNIEEIVSNSDMDGSSSAKAAPNAKYIQSNFTNYTDGVYWINLPKLGPTQIYCILNSSVDGGGWMMMMKATRGTTFQYSSTYWTDQGTVLNTGNTNRNDGDAKFNTMNYFWAKDMMALWPDITTVGGSMSLSAYGCWSWLQNNFNNSKRVNPVHFFNTVNRLFLGDANNFAGKGSQFSSQTDVRFYGFNYYDLSSPSTSKVRWGFGWNENGGGLYPNGNETSNDVTGGIGMTGVFATNLNYSAGDQMNCCGVTGINRSARVEIYVR